MKFGRFRFRSRPRRATATVRFPATPPNPATRTSFLLDNLLSQQAYIPNICVDIAKVRSDYDGPGGMRVRRSSDSAIANIAFTASLLVDEAAIVTHCGADTGYVERLFNQSAWTKTLAVSGVDTTANTVTTATHGIVTGTRGTIVSFLSGTGSDGEPTYLGEVPGGLTSGTTYFLNAASTTTVTFHTTLADAVAGTNAIDLTTSGTGALVLACQTTRVVSSINTGTDVLTATAHGFYTGARVRLYASTTMPGGLTANADYYMRSASANTLTLHLTPEAATANTGIIDVTSAGSGTILIVEQGDVFNQTTAEQPVIYNGTSVKKTYGCMGIEFDNVTTQGLRIANPSGASSPIVRQGGDYVVFQAGWYSPNLPADTSGVPWAIVGSTTRSGHYRHINQGTGALSGRVFSDNNDNFASATIGDRNLGIGYYDPTPAPTYGTIYDRNYIRQGTIQALGNGTTSSRILSGAFSIATGGNICVIGRRGTASDLFGGQIHAYMYASTLPGDVEQVVSLLQEAWT